MRDKENVHIQHNKVRYLSVSSLSISHTFKTTYTYNSYNQLISTTNPDQEGETRFWYDFYGRIVASQNPNQAEVNTFSYTLYDEIGRPVEVGQIQASTFPSENTLKLNDKGSAFKAWVVANEPRTEVTRTRYDQTLDQTIDAKFATGKQENLRMRVASVMHYSIIDNTLMERFDWSLYQSAIHYSYDIHGNVKEVIQDVPIDSLPTNNISTQYEYELISGNMKKVSYQKEKIDQITHEYKYDNLNRLTDVLSSIDDIHYHREASYTYYDYGPLARKEIGSQRVQGQDFTYTINGWLKGMNSNTLDKTKDPGKDGTSYPSGTFASRNQRVAKDVVGFSLGYYNGDYSPIGGNPAEAAYSETNFGNGSSNLYNGNIRHMVTAIEGLDIQGYAYKYDQLQRIKEMQVYRASDVQSTFSWANSTPTDDYKTTFSYDRNGNLLSLDRNGIGTELEMDRFIYNYHILNGEQSNRLNYVVDNGTDYSSYDDIKSGQTSGNYTYNKIGELTGDAQENMILHWRTGDHKLARIERTDENSPELEFVYSPFGQRVMKIEKIRANGVFTGEVKNSFYAYDANGQVMAIYSWNFQGSSEQVKLSEQHLYGADRLGMINRDVVVYDNGVTSYTHKEEDVVHVDERGRKTFELTNHLGNVLATINDRKLYNELDGNYESVIKSFSDYYAFGMLMPNRQGGSHGRYGFNGHEKDDEIKGSGNHVSWGDYGMDPRIGRRWNIDPKWQITPGQSPYSVNHNSPISITDPNGEFGIFGAVIGAVVGAVVEIGSQAVGNLVQGKPMFQSIDWADVAISAGQGAFLAATGGLGFVASTGFEAAKAAVDYTTEDGWSFVFGQGEYEKDPTQALIDLGSGLAGSRLAKSVGKLGTKAASKVSGAISNGELLTDKKLIGAALAGALTQESITGTASGIGTGLVKRGITTFTDAIKNASIIETYTPSSIQGIQHNVSFELVIPERPKMGPVYFDETPKSLDSPSSVDNEEKTFIKIPMPKG